MRLAALMDPEVEVFTESEGKVEVRVATQELRSLHNAQAVDDDFA